MRKGMRERLRAQAKPRVRRGGVRTRGNRRAPGCMLFNSLEFLFLFLPIAWWGARASGRAFCVWICIASAVFYAFAGHVWFLAPMAATTVLDFFVAQHIARTSSGRARLVLCAASVGANLGLL